MRVYTLYLTNDLNADYFGTMNDITAIFQHYVETCRSIDIAESEFMKAIHEDSDSGLHTVNGAMNMAAPNEMDFPIGARNILIRRTMYGII